MHRISGIVPTALWLQGTPAVGDRITEAATPVTANGDGQIAQLSHISGAKYLYVVNTDAVGTAKLDIEVTDNFSGTWVHAVYKKVDQVDAPAAAHTQITIAAASYAVYRVDDYCAALKAVLSAEAGFSTGGITIRLVALPLP